MNSHSNSTFLNTCIKLPVSHFNTGPLINYDKKNNFFSNAKMNFTKKLNDQNTLSLLDFYESIPDYKDINHLSTREFYAKLDKLKSKQAELTNYSQSNCNKLKHRDNFYSYENNNNLNKDNINDDYSLYRSPTMSKIESNLITEPLTKFVKINNNGNSSYSLHNITTKCQSTQKDNSEKKCKRSKSASPLRYTPSKLTIPKPFKMTQKEDEAKLLNELLSDRKCLRDKKDNDNKSEILFKSNPTPLTSKIPFYKQVLADQEHRSQLVKLSSNLELQSQMKPFSFDNTTITTTEQNKTGCLRKSFSYPQITITGPESTDNLEDHLYYNMNKSKNKNNCPQDKGNKYSNYFYQKLWHDEYFKALNRKIRAEELLKISTLPFSKKYTDKTTDTTKQHQSSMSKEYEIKSRQFIPKRGKRRRLNKKTSNYDVSQEKIKDNLNEKHNEFITTCPNPFEFETEIRNNKRNNKISPSATNSSKNSTNLSSPAPIYSTARPNLAANLRTEWIRKKLLSHSQNEGLTTDSKKKNKFRKMSWGVRRSPAWKSIYFDNTNEEDISLRLATRLAEQRVRQEEHQINMELMRQRVRSTPLLLEGPTHWEPRRTENNTTHKCCRVNNLNNEDKFVKKSLKDSLQSETKHRRIHNHSLSNYSHSTKGSPNNLEADDLESIDKAFL